MYGGLSVLAELNINQNIDGFRNRIMRSPASQARLRGIFGRTGDISHLIGGLASVVETFPVCSPEEQHASTTLLQEQHLLYLSFPLLGNIVNIISSFLDSKLVVKYQRVSAGPGCEKSSSKLCLT